VRKEKRFVTVSSKLSSIVRGLLVVCVLSTASTNSGAVPFFVVEKNFASCDIVSFLLHALHSAAGWSRPVHRSVFGIGLCSGDWLTDVRLQTEYQMSSSTDAETSSSTVLLRSADKLSIAQYEAMPLSSTTSPGRPGSSQTLLKSYYNGSRWSITVAGSWHNALC
jgi:hypothetical protein